MEQRVIYPWESPCTAPQQPSPPPPEPSPSLPTEAAPPKPPAYVLAHAFQENQVTLLWGQSRQADGYLIHRGEDPLSLKPIAAVEEASYIDSQTRAASTYYYTVRAYNEHGQSGNTPVAAVTLPAEKEPEPLPEEPAEVPAPAPAPASASAPLPPEPSAAATPEPYGLKAFTQGTKHILLQWTAPAPGLEYRLYRSETPWCCYGLAAETEETEFLDTVPEAATKYYYFVQAVRDGRSSQASPMAEALTYPALPPPEPPGNLRAGAQGTDAMELRWNHARGAAAYVIYARLDPNEEFRIIGHTLDNSYLHEDLPPDAFVDYRVQSYHDSAASELSGICTGRSAVPRPAPRSQTQSNRPAAPRFPSFSLQAFRGG